MSLGIFHTIHLSCFSLLDALAPYLHIQMLQPRWGLGVGEARLWEVHGFRARLHAEESSSNVLN